MTTDELMEMKKELERRKNERERLRGRLEQLKNDLRKTHGCATVREASKKLVDMKSTLAKLLSEYERKCDEFRKNYMKEDEL